MSRSPHYVTTCDQCGAKVDSPSPLEPGGWYWVEVRHRCATVKQSHVQVRFDVCPKCKPKFLPFVRAEGDGQ